MLNTNTNGLNEMGLHVTSEKQHKGFLWRGS